MYSSRAKSYSDIHVPDFVHWTRQKRGSTRIVNVERVGPGDQLCHLLIWDSLPLGPTLGDPLRGRR